MKIHASFASLALAAVAYCDESTFSGRNALGAVACESELCSKLGADLLEKGGNAADAMVGTVICVGTVAMYHSGIGGGGFMVIRTPEDKYEVIDFRETAPAAASQDMFAEDVDLSITGGLASGVPGEIRGLHALHSKYGKLPWAKVIKPSADIARDGFVVNEDLVIFMDKATAGTEDFLLDDASWAIDFARNGRRVQKGEVMTRKRFADTLYTIAEEGPDAFYSGRIAETMVNALAAEGGIMTLEDIASYEVVEREPVQIDLNGYKLTSSGAPSSGAIMMNILKTIGGYPNFNEIGRNNLSTHRLNEAMRFAYALRTKLGDPSYVPSLKTFQDEFLSDETVAEIRQKIDDDRTFPVEYYNPEGLESLDTPGTSQISVADSSGLAISLTSTINLLFGSQLMVPETGIIMNNEMNDFSIPNATNAFGFVPSEANFIRPGKRPLSSISPLIITGPAPRANGTGANEDAEGEDQYDRPEFQEQSPSLPSVLVSVGASGGSRIITAVAQAAAMLVPDSDNEGDYYHRNIADRSGEESLPSPPPLGPIVAAPRLHDQLLPARTTLESWYDFGVADSLLQKGHNVTLVAAGQSAVQVVRWTDVRGWEGQGEPRQINSGAAVGGGGDEGNVMDGLEREGEREMEGFEVPPYREVELEMEVDRQGEVEGEGESEYEEVLQVIDRLRKRAVGAGWWR